MAVVLKKKYCATRISYGTGKIPCPKARSPRIESTNERVPAPSAGLVLLVCKNYIYGNRLTLTDSDAANCVSKYQYANQFRPAAVTNPVSERPVGSMQNVQVRVPHHYYLQNLNRMQRGETGAKIFC